MSRSSVLLSTYQASSSNLLSQSTAFRPLTWAQPVIPGRTSCLLACSGVYSGRYSINNGRGPTRLMSPRRTFQSSGSSSMLDALRILPSRVNLMPSVSVSTSLLSVRVMVLNLISLKARPPRPGRSWRNSTGQPEVARIKTPTAIRIGDNTIKAVQEISTSIARFMSEFATCAADSVPVVVKLVPDAARRPQGCTHPPYGHSCTNRNPPGEDPAVLRTRSSSQSASLEHQRQVRDREHPG